MNCVHARLCWAFLRQLRLLSSQALVQTLPNCHACDKLEGQLTCQARANSIGCRIELIIDPLVITAASQVYGQFVHAGRLQIL